MFYDTELIAYKIRRWEKYLREYTIPCWEDIPDMGLYMDQVISLLSQYLDFLPKDEQGEATVTATAINNYVRIKIMPPPEKKRYYRVHIAYLIMICSLKQSVSISNVQKIIPMGLTDDEVRFIYDRYADKHKTTALYFIDQVRLAAVPVTHPEERSSENPVGDLVTTAAVISGLSRLFAEKLIRLQGENLEEVMERDRIADSQKQ